MPEKPPIDASATRDVPSPFAGAAELALAPDQFTSWWQTSVAPDDRAEYIHLHGGNLEGARLVCVLEYLVSVLQNKTTDDVIVRAYMVAVPSPANDIRATSTRSRARALFEDDAVQMLWERVRYRTSREAEIKIEQRVTARLEVLFDRLDAGEDDGTGALDKTVLASAMTYLEMKRKTSEGAANRRAQKAVARAIEGNASRTSDKSAPPTLQEAEQFVKMLVGLHGADAVEGIIKKSMLPAVPSEEVPK